MILFRSTKRPGYEIFELVFYKYKGIASYWIYYDGHTYPLQVSIFIPGPKEKMLFIWKNYKFYKQIVSAFYYSINEQQLP